MVFSYLQWLTKKTIYKFKPVLIMKKLLFTALAVVAFNGIAMANTIEVKEEIISNSIKIELTNQQAEVKDCYTKAADYVDNVYDPNGNHSSTQNNAVFQAYLDGCLGN